MRASSEPFWPLHSDPLWPHFHAVRRATEALCTPLATEDYVIQSMPDASPAKWHLAHTTWFFETFVLRPFLPGYRVFHPSFHHLFNSYYETAGAPYPRAERGLLGRPTVEEIYRYRAHVDRALEELRGRPSEAHRAEIEFRLTLGLHHEQQHQELLLTDIKHAFSLSPLRPSYRSELEPVTAAASKEDWIGHGGGVVAVGHAGAGFGFDNETPGHRVYLHPFVLATRPVTNADYLEFMADGGYRRAELWLADGWRTVKERAWQTPLYWERIADDWWHMTLAGMRPVDAHEPVSHVSYYEADAYARWRGRRLPTEVEWEHAVKPQPIDGNLLENGRLHPDATPTGGHVQQAYGDVWEWTASAYAAYPGYRPLSGSLGEYNGKFMCNQFVLRGGSCATPRSHIRASYRNFFAPAARWQFAGIRLADDA